MARWSGESPRVQVGRVVELCDHVQNPRAGFGAHTALIVDEWQYLQAVLAYAVPPIVALFLAGLFWRGANAAGAIATLGLGTACGMALFIVNAVFHWVHLHFLYVAPLLLSIDLGILVSVSLSRRSTLSADAAALLWSGAQFRAESIRLKAVSVLANYRVQAMALLALTACIVFAFR